MAMQFYALCVLCALCYLPIYVIYIYSCILVQKYDKTVTYQM